ncbi:MAG: ExeA family protein [Gammaproteobacteria bacterium]
MYVDHFNLSHRTFTNAPETDFFMPNEQVSSAIARLRQVMLARDSVAIVTGGPGVGKSAFVAAAQATIEDKSLLLHADLRHTDSDMLASMLLLNMGVDEHDSSEAAVLNQLRVAIRRQNESGRRVTAVIDVSGMTVERAKRILQLVHLSGEPGGQLNIVLVGPHALHRLLNAPGLIHLRQRVGYRYRVRPFTVDEVDCYLEEQFERAGGAMASIMEDGAADTVFRYVGGVPRLINTLMDAALCEAAVQYENTISINRINAVAQELGWKPLAAQQPRAVKTAAETNAPAKPPELSVEQQVASPQSEPRPVSEATAMMLLDPQEMSSDSPPARDFPKATDKIGDHPGVIPEMSASDTSATGMLRLEELDARFAETVFGEDATKAASDALAAEPEIPEKLAG